VTRIGVGIVGFGKIAREQHVAAIRATRELALRCVADTAATPAPVPRYASIETMLSAVDAPQAVAICTPPQARYRAARYALERGKHVLLEKPPATTLGELEELRELAQRAGVALFCAWHSQYAPAVPVAREWLAARRLRRVRIDWREDVRVWHPGQRWIWEPGGFGVFDPGINALSIAATILPKRLLMRDALLSFPENCATPIAAELTLTDADATPIRASFDFLQTGPQTWQITVETDAGQLLLSHGGARLWLDGHETALPPAAEYSSLYARFARLIGERGRDVDATPLTLVADALLVGRRVVAPAFADPEARP
jgi:D-galactose 1-dehydrogenase